MVGVLPDMGSRRPAGGSREGDAGACGGAGTSTLTGWNARRGPEVRSTHAPLA
jgi:hypothetical protein